MSKNRQSTGSTFDIQCILICPFQPECSNFIFSIKPWALHLISYCFVPLLSSILEVQAKRITNMHPSLLSFLAFTITSIAAPNPSTPPASSPTKTPFFYKPLTLTFYGGPASYTMDFPADGDERNTGLTAPFSTRFHRHSPLFSC